MLKTMYLDGYQLHRYDFQNPFFASDEGSDNAEVLQSAYEILDWMVSMFHTIREEYDLEPGFALARMGIGPHTPQLQYTEFLDAEDKPHGWGIVWLINGVPTYAINLE